MGISFHKCQDSQWSDEKRWGKNNITMTDLTTYLTCFGPQKVEFLYHHPAQKRRFKSESNICSIFLLPCLRRYLCSIRISLAQSGPNFRGAFSSLTFLLQQGRLGAVACLQLAVKHFKIEDHVLVIGGWVYQVSIINQLPSRVVTAAKSRPVSAELIQLPFHPQQWHPLQRRL